MTKAEYKKYEDHTRELYKHRQKDRKAKAKVRTIFVLPPMELLTKWQKNIKKEGAGNGA